MATVLSLVPQTWDPPPRDATGDESSLSSGTIFLPDLSTAGIPPSLPPQIGSLSFAGSSPTLCHPDMRFFKGLTKKRFFLAVSLDPHTKNLIQWRHRFRVAPSRWWKNHSKGPDPGAVPVALSSPEITASESLSSHGDDPSANPSRFTGTDGNSSLCVHACWTDDGSSVFWSEEEGMNYAPSHFRTLPRLKPWTSDATTASSQHTTTTDPSLVPIGSKSCLRLPRRLFQYCHSSHKSRQACHEASSIAEARDDGDDDQHSVPESSAHFSVTDSAFPASREPFLAPVLWTRWGTDCEGVDPLRIQGSTSRGSDSDCSDDRPDVASIASRVTLDRYLSRTVDISDVAADDCLSVQSHSLLAVSFDQEYAQLIFAQPSSAEAEAENDEAEAYIQETAQDLEEEVLGISFAHPASQAPQDDGVRSTRQVAKAQQAVSHEPWDDYDCHTNSFRMEEWSVAPASVLIEASYTDWEDNDDDGIAWSFSRDDAASINHDEFSMTVVKPTTGLLMSARTPGKAVVMPVLPPALCGCDTDIHSSDESYMDCPFDEPSPHPSVSTAIKVRGSSAITMHPSHRIGM